MKGAWRAKVYEVFHQINWGDLAAGIETAKQVLKELESQPNIQTELLSLLVEDLARLEKHQEMIDVVEPYYNKDKHPIGIGIHLVLSFVKVKNSEKAYAMFDSLKDQLRKQNLDQVFQHCEEQLKELKK